MWAGLQRRDPAFPSNLAAKTVIHCPYQILHPKPGRQWNLPYVINLHDLQHEHFPEFFSAKDLERRKMRYLASATAAQAVCVVDEWTRRDVLSHLPIPESKVHVAPFGPTWEEAPPLTPEDREQLLESYDLPQAFAFYPAQTWPHKNHARLVEALGVLNQRGVCIPLVCTGHVNDHGTQIMAQVEALGLGSQVRFLGLIPGRDIKRLYQAARMTVIPTLFEGGPGIPVMESMALGSPLAASRACGIPEAVGDSAVLFDPLDVGDMVGAIERIWKDDDLRAGLAERAKRRSALNTWKRAAATYKEVYAEALLRWKADHDQ
jgi:glycosyltransferase involved in cell wall biosynthesis